MQRNHATNSSTPPTTCILSYTPRPSYYPSNKPEVLSLALCTRRSAAACASCPLQRLLPGLVELPLGVVPLLKHVAGGALKAGHSHHLTVSLFIACGGANLRNTYRNTHAVQLHNCFFRSGTRSTHTACYGVEQHPELNSRPAASSKLVAAPTCGTQMKQSGLNSSMASGSSRHGNGCWCWHQPAAAAMEEVNKQQHGVGLKQ